jgi:amino acid transporter
VVSEGLKRQLGVWDGIAIVAGVVIGAGIFVTPQIIARSLGDPLPALAAWLAAGMLSMLGAMAFAELAAMMPATGGHAVFLREAFGPAASFLYAWILFAVVQGAVMAFLALSFTRYLAYFIPHPEGAQNWIATALLLLLATLNIRGTGLSAGVQRTVTLAKIIALGAFIAGGLMSGGSGQTAWTWPNSGVAPAAFGLGMIGCLYSYEGWSYVAFVSGEIRDPQRNLPRVLLGGLAAVVSIYVLVTFCWLRVLTPEELAASQQPGAVVAERLFGRLGGAVLSATAMAAIFSSMNAVLLSTTRVFFEQSRAGLFLEPMGRLHARYGTPAWSLIAQTLWAGALVWAGAYESLLDAAVLGSWIFYALTVGALLVLRRTRPDLPRPFRLPWAPWSAGSFIAAALWFLWNGFAQRKENAIACGAALLAGVALYGLRRIAGTKIRPPS